MKSQYSEEFIEQALVKLLSRGSRSVKSVAQELNVNYHTAKNWLKRGSTVKADSPSVKERRPQDWNAQDQLVALHETHALSGDALQAWCRARGLFIRDVSRIVPRLGPRVIRLAVKDPATQRRMADILTDALGGTLAGRRD